MRATPKDGGENFQETERKKAERTEHEPGGREEEMSQRQRH